MDEFQILACRTINKRLHPTWMALRLLLVLRTQKSDNKYKKFLVRNFVEKTIHLLENVVLDRIGLDFVLALHTRCRRK